MEVRTLTIERRSATRQGEGVKAPGRLLTIGGVSKPDMGYSRDGIEIAFTDGSMIVIDPIANTGNWEDRVQGFDKREMNVRLDVTLVPNARCQ